MLEEKKKKKASIASKATKNRWSVGGATELQLIAKVIAERCEETKTTLK